MMEGEVAGKKQMAGESGGGGKGGGWGGWEALLRLGKFAVLWGVLGAQLSAVSWEPLLCPLQLP